MKSKFDRVLEDASREVDTMAVWRSLSVKDREKAIRLLIGPSWKSLYRATIERYVSSLR